MQIHYPFGFDDQGRTAVCEESAHVREMIEQVLFTSPGERVNRPDFGSGLLQMTFAPNSDVVAAALQADVHGSLQRWLGDLIDLHNLAIENVDSRLLVEVTYSLRRTGEPRTERFDRRVP